MVLVDTSVWISHFRSVEAELARLLSREFVLIHVFIRGELASGHLKARSNTLSYLAELPSCKLASNEEVFDFLEESKLWGQGLGWIDLHLLASALLSPCRLWTLDKRLASAARSLGLT